MQAGDPAQPVQQSVVIASILGRFLRAALPSPSDMGQCFSTMSYMLFVYPVRLCVKQTVSLRWFVGSRPGILLSPTQSNSLPYLSPTLT